MAAIYQSQPMFSAQHTNEAYPPTSMAEYRARNSIHPPAVGGFVPQQSMVQPSMAYPSPYGVRRSGIEAGPEALGGEWSTTTTTTHRRRIPRRAGREEDEDEAGESEDDDSEDEDTYGRRQTSRRRRSGRRARERSTRRVAFDMSQLSDSLPRDYIPAPLGPGPVSSRMRSRSLVPYDRLGSQSAGMDPYYDAGARGAHRARGISPTMGTTRMDMPSGFGEGEEGGYHYSSPPPIEPYGNRTRGYSPQTSSYGSGTGTGRSSPTRALGRHLALVPPNAHIGRSRSESRSRSGHHRRRHHSRPHTHSRRHHHHHHSQTHESSTESPSSTSASSASRPAYHRRRSRSMGALPHSNGGYLPPGGQIPMHHPQYPNGFPTPYHHHYLPSQPQPQPPIDIADNIYQSTGGIPPVGMRPPVSGFFAPLTRFFGSKMQHHVPGAGPGLAAGVGAGHHAAFAQRPFSAAALEEQAMAYPSAYGAGGMMGYSGQSTAVVPQRPRRHRRRSSY